MAFTWHLVHSRYLANMCWSHWQRCYQTWEKVAVCILSRVWLLVTPWTVFSMLLYPWDYPGENTGVGCCYLLQEIFPTQGWNPHLSYLLHWQSFTSSAPESEVAQSCLTLCDPVDCRHQAPPSMGFSRQEYWSGLPFPSPGNLPDPGIELRSPTLQSDALTSEPPGKPTCVLTKLTFLHPLGYIHSCWPSTLSWYCFPQNYAHSLVNIRPCLMTCWILVPCPGIELAPSAVKARGVLVAVAVVSWRPPVISSSLWLKVQPS